MGLGASKRASSSVRLGPGGAKCWNGSQQYQAGLLIHFSLLALWGQPAGPGLPAPCPPSALPPALANTGLGCAWGRAGHRALLPVLNQDSPGPRARLPQRLLQSLIFTSPMKNVSHLRKPRYAVHLQPCNPHSYPCAFSYLAAGRCGFTWWWRWHMQLCALPFF